MVFLMVTATFFFSTASMAAAQEDQLSLLPRFQPLAKKRRPSFIDRDWEFRGEEATFPIERTPDVQPGVFRYSLKSVVKHAGDTYALEEGMQEKFSEFLMSSHASLKGQVRFLLGAKDSLEFSISYGMSLPDQAALLSKDDSFTYKRQLSPAACLLSAVVSSIAPFAQSEDRD